MQHQDLASSLGIRKQNINMWIKRKQDVSKKYLPTLAAQFNVPEEYFQKELNEIDRLIVQKAKLQKELEPVIVGYEQQFSFGTEDEPDIIEFPIYDAKEINEIEFEIERIKVLEGFRGVLAKVEKKYILNIFEQIVLLFEKHGEEPALLLTIDSLSHHFGVLPEWVGSESPETIDFIRELEALLYEFDPTDYQ